MVKRWVIRMAIAMSVRMRSAKSIEMSVWMLRVEKSGRGSKVGKVGASGLVCRGLVLSF